MTRKLLVFGLISTLSLLVGGVSRADTLLFFDLSGPITATFYLPVDPTINPDNVDPGFGFTVAPIDLMINGAPSNDYLAFYNESAGGGLGAFSSSVADDLLVVGSQLYSGGEGNPALAIESALALDDFNNTNITYSLTVTSVTPEPTELLLLLTGVALLVALKLA